MKPRKTSAPPGGRRSRVTSYDVARHAEVSQSAVSRCFKAGASVAPETRAKILTAARELGYQPNAIARGLITRRSHLVAVIISNLTNLYYPEVLAELTQRLSTKDTRVLLFALQNESDVDAVLDQVWRYQVDGAIAAARLTRAQIEAFDERAVPLVLYNRAHHDAPCASVCCDSFEGERALVERLLAAGHRRFGLIAGPADSYVGEERIRAAQDLLRAAGIAQSPVVRGAFSYDSGRAGMRALAAEMGTAIDAVICANDVMAIGAIDCARAELGLRVPEQISIVGFDGVGPAGWSSYQLTTIRQPVRRMTAAAVDMLIERINNPEIGVERRLFSGTLIEGGSARIR